MCLSNLAIFMFNSNIQFCLCFFFVQSGSCLFYNTHFCLHVYCWAVFFLSAFLCTRQSFVHTKSSTGPHTHTLELYDRAMSKQSNENILIDMDDCEFLAVHQLASVILGWGEMSSGWPLLLSYGRTILFPFHGNLFTFQNSKRKKLHCGAKYKILR